MVDRKRKHLIASQAASKKNMQSIGMSILSFHL